MFIFSAFIDIFINIKNIMNSFKHLKTFINEFFFFFVKIYYKCRYIKFYFKLIAIEIFFTLYIAEKVKTH